jgi:hypothetical protein
MQNIFFPTTRYPRLTRLRAAEKGPAANEGRAPRSFLEETEFRHHARVAREKESGSLPTQMARDTVILLVANSGSPLLVHADWLQRDCRYLGAVGDHAQAEVLLAGQPRTDRLLVVDLAVFVNIASDIDRLIGFRRRQPDVPVVIASTQFGYHDLSCERAAIADASLKLPASRKSTCLALNSALDNFYAKRSLIRLGG